MKTLLCHSFHVSSLLRTKIIQYACHQPSNTTGTVPRRHSIRMLRVDWRINLRSRPTEAKGKSKHTEKIYVCFGTFQKENYPKVTGLSNLTTPQFDPSTPLHPTKQFQYLSIRPVLGNVKSPDAREYRQPYLPKSLIKPCRRHEKVVKTFSVEGTYTTTCSTCFLEHTHTHSSIVSQEVMTIYPQVVPFVRQFNQYRALTERGFLQKESVPGNVFQEQ